MGGNSQTDRMIRRSLALALWAYFAWYLAATLASIIGAPSVAGPTAALLTLGVGAIGWARARRGAPTPAQGTELHPAR